MHLLSYSFLGDVSSVQAEEPKCFRNDVRSMISSSKTTDNVQYVQNIYYE